MIHLKPLTPRERKYLPNEFKLTVWSKSRPYFNELLKRDIQSVEDLEIWLLDRSELSAVIREEFNWRYVNVSRDTDNQQAAELYEYAIQELAPKIAPIENQLNEKLLNRENYKSLNYKSIKAYRVKNLSHMDSNPNFRASLYTKGGYFEMMNKSISRMKKLLSQIEEREKNVDIHY